MTAATAAFERALSALVAHDVEAYAAGFAPGGVIEWPFATGDFVRRVEGRAAIAAHVGQNLARSRAAGRKLAGPFDVVLHPVGERRLVVEFTVEVTAGGPRLPYVHVYELDEGGLIATLRDYFGGATQRAADEARAAGPAR